MTFHLQPRPQANGAPCATPSDADMIEAYGGSSFEGVAFSDAQRRDLEKLYGYDLARSAHEAIAYSESEYRRAMLAYDEAMATEADPWKRERLVKPKPPDPGGIAKFFISGNQLHMFRHAQCDGLRLIALLAHHVEPGRDPVRVLARLMIDAGWDVQVEPDWVDGDETGEEE